VELLIGLLVPAVLIPIVVWFVDEGNGRTAWRREARIHERFDLGEGAFRATHVDHARTEVLRSRAPFWVRLLAFTSYLPLGVAILALVPWFVGVLMLNERRGHHFHEYANTMLVIAYPFGCWAAVRMAALGRALLSGHEARFRGSLGPTLVVELTLNAALLLGAFLLSLRHPHADAWMLFVAPLVTLSHLALMATVGLRQTRKLTLARTDSEAPPAPAPDAPATPQV